MKSYELRKTFIDYFVNKNHLHYKAAPLISTDDPSVLFNVAGMQQFKPFYLDPQKAPASKVVTVQPCLRTIDIDEVGDDTHLTVFEMLGNFSFNDYFKEKAIESAWTFLTEIIKIDPRRMHATYFAGDDETPMDTESLEILKGIKELPKIVPQDREDNFWGPTGSEGPCGPTVELYIDNIEIWNLVFNEYYKELNGKYRLLKYKGVDTGMGFERLLTVINDEPSVYNTDLFLPVLKKLNDIGIADIRTARIIADHLKASLFLMNEGIRPKNLGREYVLRKLLRRVMMHEIINDEVESIFEIIKSIYSDMKLISASEAVSIYKVEYKVFKKSLAKGLSVLEAHMAKDKTLTGKDAFDIYSTYGIPLEAQKDYLGNKIEIDTKGFESEFAASLAHHKEISRAGIEAKFGGHGINDEERVPNSVNFEDLQKIKANHTATHLLQQALREVLGDHICQKGSDVAPERLRFDFSHSSALTQDEKEKIEKIVNQKIQENLPVFSKLMSLEEARETGALAFFDSKYGDKVKVYFIGNNDGTAWSKELCAGPHVKSTGEIKAFKITSEKSSSAGIRRIKAVTGKF